MSPTKKPHHLVERLKDCVGVFRMDGFRESVEGKTDHVGQNGGTEVGHGTRVQNRIRADKARVERLGGWPKHDGKADWMKLAVEVLIAFIGWFGVGGEKATRLLQAIFIGSQSASNQGPKCGRDGLGLCVV